MNATVDDRTRGADKVEDNGKLTMPLQWCDCGSIMSLIDQTDFSKDNYLNHISVQTGNLFDLLSVYD